MAYCLHMARPRHADDRQLAAFAHALASHLTGTHDTANLARSLGVDRATVYNWRDGKREPERSQVFAIETALGLPAGSLSHLLGYLPVGAYSVEQAITSDPDLSASAKRALLAAYAASRR